MSANSGAARHNLSGGLGRHSGPRSVLRSWWRLAWPVLFCIGAIGLVVAGLGWQRFAEEDRLPPVSRQTGRGEQAVMRLPDGSVVTLDSATRIVYWESDRERLLNLNGGRIHVEVKPDPSLPFSVTMPGGRVTALGTAFDVDFDGSRSVITLQHGSVRVWARGSATAVVLEPGQQVTLRKSGQMSMPMPVNLDRESAWASGELIFDQTPLPDAVKTLDRYLLTPLHADDPALAELRIDGRYRIHDLDASTSTLIHSLPVTVVSEADGVHLSALPAVSAADGDAEASVVSAPTPVSTPAPTP